MDTTTSAAIRNLEKLLGGPRDGALLRYSIGLEHLKAGEAARAVDYLREALERDPKFSAAWKSLGKALLEGGLPEEALETWQRGMVVAEARGDLQAAKEMQVFARRLEKTLGAG
jgi:tetratricopeptide (TPR) repeat protein